MFNLQNKLKIIQKYKIARGISNIDVNSKMTKYFLISIK